MNTGTAEGEARLAEAEQDDSALAAEREHRDERARLSHLYTHAGDLEVELGDLARRSPDAPLTAAQVGRYNQILRDARDLIPASVALREDATEIDERETLSYRVADVHRWLHTALVPTLHNALPEDEYDRRS